MCAYPINLCNSLGSGLSDPAPLRWLRQRPWLESVINFPFCELHCLGSLLSFCSGIRTSGITTHPGIGLQNPCPSHLPCEELSETRSRGTGEGKLRQDGKTAQRVSFTSTKSFLICKTNLRLWHEKYRKTGLNTSISSEEDLPDRGKKPLQIWMLFHLVKVGQRSWAAC